MRNSKTLKLIIAGAIYILMYIIGSSSGLIHPACYAYAGTFMPLLFSFVHLYTAANMQCFGAAFLLNIFLLVIACAAGEGDTVFVYGLPLLALLAELIRGKCGYDTIKGVRLSFIPFAYSFYTYSAHWWTDTEGSLEAAVAEMPVGYAAKMEPVIADTTMLIIMLVLTVPVSVVAMRIAEKVLKKEAAKLR